MAKTVVELIIEGQPDKILEISKSAITVGRHSSNDVEVGHIDVSRFSGEISPAVKDPTLRKWTEGKNARATILLRDNKPPVRLSEGENIILGPTDTLLIGGIAKLKILKYE